MKKTKLTQNADISKLNALHAKFETAAKNLKEAYEHAESDFQQSVKSSKKSYDLASAKLNLAIKSLKSPVKFDTDAGTYFLAHDPETGKEIFVIQAKVVSTSCFRIAADNLNDAYKQVEKLIVNNEVDVEDNPTYTLEDISVIP